MNDWPLLLLDVRVSRQVVLTESSRAGGKEFAAFLDAGGTINTNGFRLAVIGAWNIASLAECGIHQGAKRSCKLEYGHRGACAFRRDT